MTFWMLDRLYFLTFRGKGEPVTNHILTSENLSHRLVVKFPEIYKSGGYTTFEHSMVQTVRVVKERKANN